MNHRDLQDYCCWKLCPAESDMIFMGAGMCDEHFALALATYKQPFEYAVDRVIPEAARAMREQNKINQRNRGLAK